MGINLKRGLDEMSITAYFDTLMTIFCSGAALVIFLALYLALAFADLFKRHLLSNGTVYYLTMFLAPAAVFSAVGTPVCALIYRESTAKIIFAFIGGTALLLVSAAVYIRGHILPIDKVQPRYEGSAAVSSAWRLIAAGLAGTLVYGVLTILNIGKFLEMIMSGVPELGLSSQEIIPTLFILAVLMLVPFYNLLIILGLLIEYSSYLLIGAGVFVVITAFAVMTLLADFLVLNGCIRYILSTDKTKGKKVLFIILSIIPVFNIVYGFICLSNIAKKLKNSAY